MAQIIARTSQSETRAEIRAEIRGGVLSRLEANRAGNTLPIVAAALAPLLALVGGGVDLGRSYLSEARLQQACDAGVLAARKELGSSNVPDGVLPAAVDTIGHNYFNLNFADGAYGTEDRTFDMTLEDDYAVSGEATVTVPTTIMKIFGSTEIPLSVECTANLNFSNTDIMMVLDTTGSMNETNDDDEDPRIDVLKQVVRNFHNQLETAKGPGIRVRYGFVPYSTNVNVGGVLEDDWVVDDWFYQSRMVDSTGTAETTNTYWANWTYISGTQAVSDVSSYPATHHDASGELSSAYWSCDTAPPPDTATSSYVLLSTTSEPYVGPPAGTKTIKHYRRTLNYTDYWIERTGNTCYIKKVVYDNLIHEYDEITTPAIATTANYIYDRLPKDVSNWRTETAGCMEERSTYKITDYNNVDLNQALDLNLDLVPTAGDPTTQWRPQYPNIIWERELNWWGSGSFTIAPVLTTNAWMFKATNNAALVACPAPARKLAEIPIEDVGVLDGYLASITASGTTYHDIGMIWGGRLISQNGLFASENVDVDNKPTKRHLIFLTDGLTEAFDIAYGAYGVEPLDRRRWEPGDTDSLPVTVEKRFKFACEEVRRRNITIWIVNFGVSTTQLMTDCAGDAQHVFEAGNATELNQAFYKIAKAMGELRVTR